MMMLNEYCRPRQKGQLVMVAPLTALSAFEVLTYTLESTSTIDKFYMDAVLVIAKVLVFT